MDSKNKTGSSVMTDMLAALLALSVVAVYYCGPRAAFVIILTAAASIAADHICLYLRKKEFDRKDLSALITGLTLGLMMSAAVPYYMAITAAVFSIVVGKHAFGGRGSEIFNPAAVGFLFTALCFPDAMLTYPKPFDKLPMSSLVPSDMLFPSMTKTFLLTDTSDLSLIDTVIGKFCGPMGAGILLVLVTAAVFLMLRRSISAITFFTELGALSLYALIKYEFDPMALAYFFAGGMTLFGMIFISCDYTVMPKTKSSRFLMGLVSAVLIMVFNSYAKAENAVIYAVIIAAPIRIELDRRALSFADMLKKRKPKKSGKNSKNKAKAKARANGLLGHISETLDILDNDSNDSGNAADTVGISKNGSAAEDDKAVKNDDGGKDGKTDKDNNDNDKQENRQ